MTSASAEALAASIASRKDPGPESFVDVTVKVAASPQRAANPRTNWMKAADLKDVGGGSAVVSAARAKLNPETRSGREDYKRGTSLTVLDHKFSFGRRCFHEYQSAKASLALTTASTSVSPALAHPGSSGNAADQRFTSGSNSITRLRSIERFNDRASPVPPNRILRRNDDHIPEKHA